MADLMSAALFEKGQHVLTAHRKPDRAPFAGQWLLPMTVVGNTEAAEDALRRHALQQFGVTVGMGQFVDTVYLEDPEDQRQYVTNIFRAPIESGPLRFNAAGEYDEARWVAADDLGQLAMPPALREPLVRIMTEPAYEPSFDWTADGEALPLGERAGPVEVGPPPDNRAAWAAIAAAYQEHRYGERFGERLMWSWRASEDDLHVLDDVRGKRALVLGCGGGQDVVALAKMGAVAVGVDYAPAQLAYARRHAAKHAADNASFVECDVTDLSRFDDASFDLAVCIHVLEYVEDAATALAEASRVLKPGGTIAIATKHPFGAHVDGPPPLHMWNSYWTEFADWPLDVGGVSSAPMRHYFRTMSRWFDLLTAAGFAVERVVEPQEADLPKAEGDDLDDEWMALLPYTMVMKARKR
jgi:ubiquinone/menaquinone biosynthesis C-methylase UbiE/ADP-ribose pyrophosphatase YjhB (NUDIX family)